MTMMLLYLRRCSAACQPLLTASRCHHIIAPLNKQTLTSYSKSMCILRCVKRFTTQTSCRLVKIKEGLFKAGAHPTIGGRRFYGSMPDKDKYTHSVVTYIVAAGVFMIGATYAGVPLYRMLCQTTGYGGEVQKGHDSSKVESMRAQRDRVIRIRFNADTASSMQWNFRPHQSEIKVHAGETALAFYKAKNPMDHPVVGISTYNVVPFEAGQYFNKIQCFCFEEQRLNPHEEVDLPVFFYLDPEFNDDPRMEHVDVVTLSYTFFEAKEGFTLPTPNFLQQHQRKL